MTVTRPNLETTVQELADRLEIDDLLARCAVALDNRDWDLLDTCFTPESVIDYRNVSGPCAKYPVAKQWVVDTMPLDEIMERRMTNRVIRLDGDRATGRVYGLKTQKKVSRDRGLDDGRLIITGYFVEDVYGRGPDGWRIMERIEEISWYDGDWPPEFPVKFRPLPWASAKV